MAYSSSWVFYLSHNWQRNWLILAVGPSTIVLVLLVTFLEETPQFLVKEGASRTAAVMNKIGKMNTGRQDCVN